MSQNDLEQFIEALKTNPDLAQDVIDVAAAAGFALFAEDFNNLNVQEQPQPRPLPGDESDITTMGTGEPEKQFNL